MLQRWSVQWRGNGRYRGGQYILPLNLLILFINVFLHTAIFFAYRGRSLEHARGEGGLYACKNRESMVMLWRLSL